MAGTPRKVVVEADGGSRGNPGDAAYGAIVRDAATGEVVAERGEYIGTATNNVAEYRGLIAGLELLAEHAPDAEVEVRMDSKLVVEQMAGRWKVKHPDMIPLATAARRIAPRGVRWTWVPRAENAAADALANVALDAHQGKTPRPSRSAPSARPAATNPLIGWRDASAEPPTTVLALRHGVTPHTRAKLFCGSGGSDPGLDDLGREQAARAAGYLARGAAVDAIVSSPLRRTQETAQVVADALGLPVELDEGFAEAAFGRWDGLSFAEVAERYPDELATWRRDPGFAPEGGESFDSVHARVRRAHRRLLVAHPGRRVLVVSHVTPIKMLVRLALDVPLETIYRMELAPASVTEIQWWSDGLPSLRSFSHVPEG